MEPKFHACRLHSHEKWFVGNNINIEVKQIITLHVQNARGYFDLYANLYLTDQYWRSQNQKCLFALRNMHIIHTILKILRQGAT